MVSAAWAVAAVYLARRRVRRDGVMARVPLPRRLPSSGTRGVNGVLNRLSPTCLERALVAQAWRAWHGDPRDIVIGIPIVGLKNAPAHAWLDGTDPTAIQSHVELHRLQPPLPRT
jgi:hypothetical protein